MHGAVEPEPGDLGAASLASAAAVAAVRGLDQAAQDGCDLPAGLAADDRDRIRGAGPERIGLSPRRSNDSGKCINPKADASTSDHKVQYGAVSSPCSRTKGSSPSEELAGAALPSTTATARRPTFADATWSSFRRSVRRRRRRTAKGRSASSRTGSTAMPSNGPRESRGWRRSGAGGASSCVLETSPDLEAWIGPGGDCRVNLAVVRGPDRIRARGVYGGPGPPPWSGAATPTTRTGSAPRSSATASIAQTFCCRVLTRNGEIRRIVHRSIPCQDETGEPIGVGSISSALRTRTRRTRSSACAACSADRGDRALAHGRDRVALPVGVIAMGGAGGSWSRIRPPFRTSSRFAALRSRPRPISGTTASSSGSSGGPTASLNTSTSRPGRSPVRATGSSARSARSRTSPIPGRRPRPGGGRRPSPSSRSGGSRERTRTSSSGSKPWSPGWRSSRGVRRRRRPQRRGPRFPSRPRSRRRRHPSTGRRFSQPYPIRSGSWTPSSGAGPSTRPARPPRDGGRAAWSDGPGPRSGSPRGSSRRSPAGRRRPSSRIERTGIWTDGSRERPRSATTRFDGSSILTVARGARHDPGRHAPPAARRGAHPRRRGRSGRRRSSARSWTRCRSAS